MPSLPDRLPNDSSVQIMKPKPRKSIDNLLGELGFHPDSVDPDEVAAKFDPFGKPNSARLPGPCGKCCYNSEITARKAGNRIKSHGANTSFFRPYFCDECKAWHLTSGKNVGPSHSSEPNRNAGRKRRNHHQTPPSDDS
jgi:hypothetical protein